MRIYIFVMFLFVSSISYATEYQTKRCVVQKVKTSSTSVDVSYFTVEYTSEGSIKAYIDSGNKISYEKSFNEKDISLCAPVDMLSMSGEIRFKSNVSVLNENDKSKIRELYNSKGFKNNKHKILIDGYSDFPGKFAYNMKISIRRATEVANYLTKLGLDKNNIVIRGYGENKYGRLVTINLKP